jgi:hypothetical protein
MNSKDHTLEKEQLLKMDSLIRRLDLKQVYKIQFRKEGGLVEDQFAEENPYVPSRFEIFGRAGCHIPSLLVESELLIAMLRAKGHSSLQVTVIANGEEVVIDPSLDRLNEIAKAVSATKDKDEYVALMLPYWTEVWHYRMDEAQKAYQATPEYAIHKKQREQQVIINNENIRRMLEELTKLRPGVEYCLSHLEWVVEFSPLSDDRDSVYDKEVVANELERLGYIRSQHVRTNFSRWSQRQKVEYLIGQAIDLLRLDRSIHPTLVPLSKKLMSDSVEAEPQH